MITMMIHLQSVLWHLSLLSLLFWLKNAFLELFYNSIKVSDFWICCSLDIYMTFYVHLNITVLSLWFRRHHPYELFAKPERRLSVRIILLLLLIRFIYRSTEKCMQLHWKMSYYIAQNEHKIIKKHECFDRFVITCYVRFEHKLLENKKVLLDLLVPFSYMCWKIRFGFSEPSCKRCT
jgi:hypothetical protein